MKIRKATKKDLNELVNLTSRLWPRHSRRELEKEFSKILKQKSEIIFVVVSTSNKIIGFTTASIKKKNTPGVNFYPAGYLEGIYVKPEFRKKNIARKLVNEVEKWAKLNKCKILASDVELKNIISQKFHKQMGFKETKKLVFFAKNLK